MNPTSAIANYFLPALVVGLAIGLAAQREARIKAGTEHAALEQQVEILRSIAAENAQLSNLVARAGVAKSLPADETSELLRLRGEVTALRQKTSNLESVVKENREVHAAPDSSARGTNVVEAAATADYWPRKSWAFAGYASPDAALQSSLWAADNGDVKAVLASATGQLRDSMEKDLSGKSENEMSARIMDEVNGLQSVQILDRAVQPDGTVVLTVQLQGQNDTQTGKLVLQQVGNEWKIAGKL